jgi:Flp pilus assembly protein TadG
MTGDWRDWRPAIWLTMLGIAVMLVVQPFYFGALFLGAAVGSAVRIQQRRRRIAAAAARTPARRARRQKSRRR